MSDEKKIDSFRVSVVEGRLCVTMSGVVGYYARIGLFEHGKDPKSQDGELILLKNFGLSWGAIEPSSPALISINGSGFFANPVNRGMKIAIFDSDDECNGVWFECDLPWSIEGKATDSYPTSYGDLPPDHQPKVNKFEVYLDNSQWCLEVDANVSKRAWVGWFDGRPFAPSDWNEYRTWEYMWKAFRPEPSPTHHDTVAMVHLNGTARMRPGASTLSTFAIYEVAKFESKIDLSRLYEFFINRYLTIKTKSRYKGVFFSKKNVVPDCR